MPSSISNFNKEKLERVIPNIPWFKLLVITGIIVIAFIILWEIFVRSLGFEPSLDDTPDLWSYARSKVSEDSHQVILLGKSQTFLDFNLNIFFKSSGIKPIQLASIATNPLIFLEDLANKTEFKGTIILGVDINPIEGINTPYDTISKRILTYYYNWNISQKLAFYLRFFLDNNLAFIGQEKIQAKNLLKNLKENKNLVDQNLLYSVKGFNRQAFMSKRMEFDEKFQTQEQNRILPLPLDKIIKLNESQHQTISSIIDEYLSKLKPSVEKIKNRGGRVILVNLPLSGKAKLLTNNLLPKANFWNRLVAESGASLNIHFDEHSLLNHFSCPDWVHLNSADAKIFTKNFLEILKNSNFQF